MSSLLLLPQPLLPHLLWSTAPIRSWYPTAQGVSQAEDTSLSSISSTSLSSLGRRETHGVLWDLLARDTGTRGAATLEEPGLLPVEPWVRVRPDAGTRGMASAWDAGKGGAEGA